MRARISDEEFIADQLNNAWEATPEDEMIDHLTRNTKYSRSKISRLVKKWYDDHRLRMKMDLARKWEWEDWLLKELN